MENQMEKSNVKNIETVNPVEEAKRLLKEFENQEIQKCSDILNDAVNKISELGYTVIIVGEFLDNKIATGLRIIKQS